MKNKDVECDIADLVTYCNENDKDVMYDFEYERITEYIEQLEKELELKGKALDKACDMLSKMKEATDCWEFEKCPFRTECAEDSSITSKEFCYNKDKWKEWCLKDE